MFGDNGIINKAQQAKIEQRKAEIIDQLNTAEAANAIDTLGKVTIETYLEEIYKEGIVVEDYTQETGDKSRLIVSPDRLRI